MKPTSWIPLIGLCLLTLGCDSKPAGRERASIHGRVTLDGQPLENGSISFRPAPGVQGTTAGGSIRDGEYVIEAEKGPSLGKMLVEINASKKSGRKVQAPMSAPGTLTDEMVEAVAPQFNSKTTLTYEVVSGDNVKDFAVTSK